MSDFPLPDKNLSPETWLELVRAVLEADQALNGAVLEPAKVRENSWLAQLGLNEYRARFGSPPIRVKPIVQLLPMLEQMGFIQVILEKEFLVTDDARAWYAEHLNGGGDNLIRDALARVPFSQFSTPDYQTFHQNLLSHLHIMEEREDEVAYALLETYKLNTDSGETPTASISDLDGSYTEIQNNVEMSAADEPLANDLPPFVEDSSGEKQSEQPQLDVTMSYEQEQPPINETTSLDPTKEKSEDTQDSVLPQVSFRRPTRPVGGSHRKASVFGSVPPSPFSESENQETTPTEDQSHDRAASLDIDSSPLRRLFSSASRSDISISEEAPTDEEEQQQRPVNRFGLSGAAPQSPSMPPKTTASYPASTPTPAESPQSTPRPNARNNTNRLTRAKEQQSQQLEVPSASTPSVTSANSSSRSTLPQQPASPTLDAFRWVSQTNTNPSARSAGLNRQPPDNHTYGPRSQPRQLAAQPGAGVPPTVPAIVITLPDGTRIEVTQAYLDRIKAENNLDTQQALAALRDIFIQRKLEQDEQDEDETH